MTQTEKRPNLVDPDFEPTDEQLARLWREAMAEVSARATAACGETHVVGSKANPEPKPGSSVI